MNSLKFALVVGLLVAGGSCYAQAPIPGSVTGQDPSFGAPAPGGRPPAMPTSPVPGNQAAAFRRLPINYQGAALRLEELRNLMPNIKPKEFQDMANDYLEWVGDLADGHWRIYQSFAKVDSLKDRAESEKQTTLKLGQLKRQAMLLKAEFLIKENRPQEALQPLVEIVVAEPKTTTGDSAYQLLRQIGFSEEPVAMPVSAVPPKPVEAPATPQTAPDLKTQKPSGKTASR
ncbi:MAG: hypothetical protein K2W95_23110 [Candidatus Obscuribacterales bacterium]|nr:hypothetical protein [Candidatus Obscuribacterales bacterium]